jgi:hypothetical protein
MDISTIKAPIECNYASDCVRDLAWAIFSPPMVPLVETSRGIASAPEFALTPARRRWLCRLDADPAPLQAFLAVRHSRFLGVYFEALWRFFLSHDDEVTLLASNRQVIDDGRTVGEFDVFYRCHRRNAIVHLELAVKFYLGLPIRTASDLLDPAYWLGPNCVDRLDLKINHLREHQLPLIGHASAREWLQQEQLHPDIQETAFHGYLYYPWHVDAPAPHAASTQHLRSFWLRDDQLEKLRTPDFAETARKYRIVPRLQWLCPHHISDEGWLDFNTFAENVRAELAIALIQPVLCEEADAGSARALRRFFVAPQDWPALHWPRKKF